MMKNYVLAFAISLATAGAAVAQAPMGVATQSQPSSGNAGARSDNVTSTGATVPNPGASQGAGTTSTDRGIMKDDNAIQNGICKGC